jgi:hypothetical protein
MSQSVHTRSVRPADIADVQGRHFRTDPLLLVVSGEARGTYSETCGKQKWS